jgi:hypothetical protein
MKTVTVRTYVVCDGENNELTEPTRDYVQAKADLLRLRGERPAEFLHLQDRTEEVPSGWSDGQS